MQTCRCTKQHPRSFLPQPPRSMPRWGPGPGLPARCTDPTLREPPPRRHWARTMSVPTWRMHIKAQLNNIHRIVDRLRRARMPPPKVPQDAYWESHVLLAFERTRRQDTTGAWELKTSARATHRRRRPPTVSVQGTKPSPHLARGAPAALIAAHCPPFDHPCPGKNRHKSERDAPSPAPPKRKAPPAPSGTMECP